MALNVWDHYKQGWKLAFSDFWRLLAVILIITIFDTIVRTAIENEHSTIIVRVIGVVVALLFVTPLKLGANYVFLPAARKKKFKVKDIFHVFTKNYLQVVLVSILTLVPIIAGFFLLILPGIYLAIRLSMVPLIIIDKNTTATQTIKESWRITKGHEWKILWLMFLGLLFTIVGIFALFVGVLVAIVWISCTFALFYETLRKKQ